MMMSDNSAPMEWIFACLFADCLRSRQHASVSQGRKWKKGKGGWGGGGQFL